MNFLLLLTALFASLTGAGSGDRQLRQVQGVAVVHAAEAVQAAVQPARTVLSTVQPKYTQRAKPSRLVVTTAELAGQHFPFERRLE